MMVLPEANSWMSPAACEAMRIPDLAVAILRRLDGLDEQWRNDHNFVQWTVDGTNGWFDSSRPITTSVYGPGTDRRAERDRLKAKLRQAWSWLEQQGYVVVDHGQRGGNWKILTDAGWEIARSTDPTATLHRVQAAAQLNLDLHPRLQAAGVETTFRGGDTDSAIRDAFADLEDAVRQLAGYTRSDYGVTMMSKAFAKSGPLGSAVDPQHQVGTQRMFEGAFAVLRNPAGHGPTGLDVAEAVETVLHADLLMRHLDTVAQKLGRPL
jgi:hypothetical protein